MSQHFVQLWEKAGANGLLGVDTPAEVGGIGGTWLDSAIVIEEQWVPYLTLGLSMETSGGDVTTGMHRSLHDK